MAGLTTAFLYVFALDALLALADLGLHLVTGVHVLAGPLAILTFALIPWTALMVALTAFLPRLPKRVLLPVCGLFGWQLLGAMPLPLHVSWIGAMWIGNLAALLLSVAIFRWLKSQTGAYQLTEAWLEQRGSAFRWGHLLACATAFALLVPLAFASYAFLSARATVDHFTAGFMALRLDGLYSIERVYERAHQRVHLIGMAHIGQKEFYRELSESLVVEDTVVLAEGVSDETDRLKEFGYGRLAEALNLTVQESFGSKDGLRVVPADVDAAEFSSSTVEVLNAIGLVLQSESRDEALQALLAYFERAGDPEVLDGVWRDLLELRNRHVLAKLDEALEEHARAVIPWGAAHMPGIEPGVIERDFTRESRTERRVIAFY